MDTSDAFDGLVCLGCGAVREPVASGRCADCGGTLDPAYDLDAVEADRLRLPCTQANLATVLPFPRDALVTAAEGGTPLVETPRVAGELGVEDAWVKDEGRNPTGSVLDRGLSLAVTAADRADADLLAVASPGNAGQSMAAFAGRVGLRSYSFVPSRTPFSTKAMVNVHGGEMRVVGGRLPDALAALREDLESEFVDCGAFVSPYRHEGAKTLAYEVLADLDWSPPDAVVVPCGSGEVAVGLAKGLRECRALGLVEEVPAIYAVQPTGCAPVATAWKTDNEETEPWTTPDTIVGELEVPDPTGGDLALEAVAETGGAVLAVDDDDALESAVAVASTEALEVGAAGGVAAAGAWSLAEDGTLGASDEVVVVNTEAAAKTPDVLRSHLMGQGA